MTLQTSAKRTFARLIDRQGMDFILDGMPNRGIKTVAKIDRKFVEQSTFDDYQFSMIVKAESLTTQPIPKESIAVLNGLPYRVIAFAQDGLDVTTRIDLGGLTDD
jgi:hypothetical protein